MSSLQFKTEDHSTTFDEENVWADDRLNREDAVRRLYGIISGQERPLTICLNGEWGSGKTFFLTRFARDYNKREPNGRAIYFNAWQDDFLDDPLLAIICQLKSVVKDKTVTALYNAVKKAALPYLANVGLKVGKQVAKQFLSLDIDALTTENLKSDEELIYEQYHSMDASRRVLREKLKEFAAETKEKTGKPLLFIIDELDRCRPTFAIELLERIKHLFCVPNLVFVVGADIRQLGKSIKAVYGDISARDYLHRFFEVEVKLPKADKLSFVYMLWDELKLEEALRVRGVHLADQRSTVENFAKLIRYRNITLRQIEKCVRTYALLSTSSKNYSCRWALLAAIAVVLNVTDEEAYRKFITMECGLGELVNLLFPGVTYREVNDESGVFDMVQHLSKIAYYRHDRTASHCKLEEVKNAIESQGVVRFDPDVMPRCFVACSPSEIKGFYAYVFKAGGMRETACFQEVPEVLRQMDEGLRFIGR